jgi:hypothetical protein
MRAPDRQHQPNQQAMVQPIDLHSMRPSQRPQQTSGRAASSSVQGQGSNCPAETGFDDQLEPADISDIASSRSWDFSKISVFAASEREPSAAPAHTAQMSDRVAGVSPRSVLRVLATPGRPLEPALRYDMEHRFGRNFGGVRVHTDAKAAESADAVRALAFTVGRDIIFAKGEYDPGSAKGRKLLIHELTHTIQQSGAANGPGPPRHPLRIEPPGTALERAAEDRSTCLTHNAPGPASIHRITLQRQPAPSPQTNQPAEPGSESDFTIFVTDPRKATDTQFARREARADAARILKSGSLSTEDRQLVNAKLRFFQGEAWKVYGREIKPALEKVAAADPGIPAPTGPPLKDILRLDQTVPIKGLAKNQSNYIDHFRGSLTSAPLGSDIILTPNEGPASKTGISIPKNDFNLDKDPLGGSSMGQNQVYKSRAVAEAVASDLMKQTPGWVVYTYYLQDGIILPTTLSDTTVPNLMPFIRQQREQNLADLKATADLAKAVALWYVGARFPIKIRPGGPAGAAGEEAAKQVEKEALKQEEKEGLKQEGKEIAKAARKPPVQPSAPPGWKGSVNAFGKEIGWPAQGEMNVAAEAADLAKLRNAGVTEQWATEQAQIYREVARMNPGNPSAALRADWLAKIAERLRGAP